MTVVDPNAAATLLRTWNSATSRADLPAPQSAEVIQAVLASIQDVIYSLSPDGQKILYATPSAERVYGIRLDAFGDSTRNWFELVHEDDRGLVKEALANIAATGSAEFTYRIRTPQGELRWMRERVRQIHDAKGNVVRLDGIGTDITAQFMADLDRELTEATVRLKDRALESTSTGVVVTDMRNPAQPIIYVNPAFTHITGYAPGDIYGANCGFLQGEDRDQPGIDELRRAIAEGHEAQVIVRNYRKDGSLFWNELSIAPVKDSSGTITHYVGIQNDITARVVAEEQLQERSDRLDAIFSLSSDGFMLFDRNDRLAYVNPAFLRMTGLTQQELIDRTEAQADDLIRSLHDPSVPYPPLMRLLDADASEEASREGRNLQTLHLLKPEKRVLQRSMRRGEGGSKVLYFRDVTRETEVDRMKSEFLSTAAHELRTPMASVYGFCELLLRRDYDEKTRRDLLTTIHRQAGALIHLLNELLDLARIEARAGKDFKIRTQPLKPIVEQTVGALLMPNDTRKVRVSLPDILPEVNVDAEKFQQALTNLLSNAYKYSPGGGEIALDIVSSASGDEIGVRVSDQGLGMTPEQLSRAFERFYRADASGNIPGTGLGLSLVKEIIEIHGGRIQLESIYKAGTRATLWLPVANAAQPGGSQPPAQHHDSIAA